MTRDISRADALKLVRGRKSKKSGGKRSGATTALAPSGDLHLKELTFFIPGMVTRSLNVTLRENPGKHHEDKKRWYDALYRPLSYLVNEECRRYKWVIDITRFGAKTLDYTNLVGGLKPLEDAIRDLGLIFDDDPNSLILSAHQKPSKEKDRGMLLQFVRGELLT